MSDTLPFRSVVVTGGDGFVGKLLVAALAPRLAPDAQLRLLGLRDRPSTGKISRTPVDIRDEAAVEAALAEASPDLVIHLAAQSSVAQGLRADGTADTWRVNLGGSLNLAQACARQGFAGTLLFVSTAEVYGRSFKDGPVHESSPLLPQSAYGRSKAAAEAMLGDVLPELSRLIIVRPSNHSGPGQDDRFVLPSFARQIARIEAGEQEPILSVGNLDAERDFLDVRDVINAYLALLNSAPSLGKRVVFNIASGQTTKIATFLDHLLALSSSAIRVEHDPARMRPSEIARAAVDGGAFREATGWRPMHPIDEMLADILAEARQQASTACSRKC